MTKTHLLSLISFGLIFIGLLTLNQVLVGMATPFVIYLIIALISQPTKLYLEFTRILSTERTTPGSLIDIFISATNHGHEVVEILVDDKLPEGILLINGSPRHLISLKPGETDTWRYTIKGSRGHYKFNTVHVQTKDRMGIITQKHRFPTGGQLLILPQLLKLKKISIRPRRTRVYSGEIPARAGGLGVDFLGVREFRPGDPPNSINWRSSAKHFSRLFTNEYEQERVADVGIILDGRERSNIYIKGESLFEYSVFAAATLSNAFLHQGDRVSLLNYGKYLQWTFPGYGKFQREKILRALSGAIPGHSLVFSYLQFLPTQIFPPQSQIVLISPLTKEDPEVLIQIRACGYRVLVISPDPVTFEQKFLPKNRNNLLATRILTIERELLLGKLTRGGIRVVNWDVSLPFDHVVVGLSKVPIIPRSYETLT